MKARRPVITPASCTTTSSTRSSTTSSPREHLQYTHGIALDEQARDGPSSLRDRSATNSAPAESMPSLTRRRRINVVHTRASRAALYGLARRRPHCPTVVGALAGTTSAGVAALHIAAHYILKRGARPLQRRSPARAIYNTPAAAICDAALRKPLTNDSQRGPTRLVQRPHQRCYGGARTFVPTFSAASLSEAGACLET